ncbi:MAG TPA: hypothetical protein VG371_15500 [Solirubrobacteraceae bacterium]|jgi:hypothetical protein|nr:hypothetical protein [Solirubrobacteraceae bacterium]
MDFETGREIGLIGIRLLDEAYMTWVAAESESEGALRAWSERSCGNDRAAYAAYRAAADREDAAARDLRRLHELTAVCLEALLGKDGHLPEDFREADTPYVLRDPHDPGIDPALPG